MTAAGRAAFLWQHDEAIIVITTITRRRLTGGGQTPNINVTAGGGDFILLMCV